MRTRARLLGRVALVGALLAALYLLVTFLQVRSAAGRDEAAPAGAIVVLGAAQWDGRPSPVLAARLDHALELWRQGLAPVVVVTGGRQPGDRFTEAAASATYLMERGVPDSALRREVQGRNTWESLAATARFLADEGITDVLLVSDPYHAFRTAAVADEVGLEARVSPVPGGPSGLRSLLRETAAVAAGRLVGYRRLVQLA